MKKFFDEFKQFALQGNVMNLAVGIIIGAAFQGVVTSLTDNILSPIIGLFTGQNFDALMVEAFGVTIKYGAFITSVLDFLIMAFVVFLIVRGMNKLTSVNKETLPEPNPTTKTCPYCISEIDINAIRCPNCTSQLDGAVQ
ncbi:MAG: large conductance mechanosensitive channel protein MscL [Anaerovoracaceae bacterium]|jgi:large conductance mechanosensitive channel